jgi:hypothetical protein
VAGDYNLKLVFSEKGTGAYLADVKLSIADMKGRKILEAVSDGPWFPVVPRGSSPGLRPGATKLAPRISAEAEGINRVQQVRVDDNRLTTRYFYWRNEARP